MASQQEIAEAVDAVVDDFDLDKIEDHAIVVGMPIKAFMERVATEVTVRLTGGVE